MSKALKQTLEIWAKALELCDDGKFEEAVQNFMQIAEESKINFNIGILYAASSNHEAAVDFFTEALAMDRFLAVAYFQRGVSNFLLRRFTEALVDFEEAFAKLRDNTQIDYEQLGLKYQLYSAEVLFNRGLTLIYSGRQQEGMTDLVRAASQKQTENHAVIDDAIKDQAAGYTVFSIGTNILFRPSENKLKNLKVKDYLGHSKLVAVTNARDAFTGFDTRKRDGPNVFKDEAEALLSNKTFKPDREKSKPALPVRSNTLPSLPQHISRSATQIRAPARSASPASAVASNRPPEDLRNGSGLLTPPLDRDPRKAGGIPISFDERDISKSRRESSVLPYDAIMGSYSQEELAPPVPGPYRGQQQQGGPNERIANWARLTAEIPPMAIQSIGLSRTSSIAGGGKSLYGDNEGTVISTASMMSKIRVKLKYQGDTRAITIAPELGLTDLREKIKVKFNCRALPLMQYKDGDGCLISLVDDDDWESAIDEAREFANGREGGKLEIYVGL